MLRSQQRLHIDSTAAHSKLEHMILTGASPSPSDTQQPLSFPHAPVSNLGKTLEAAKKMYLTVSTYPPKEVPKQKYTRNNMRHQVQS